MAFCLSPIPIPTRCFSTLSTLSHRQHYHQPLALPWKFQFHEIPLSNQQQQQHQHLPPLERTINGLSLLSCCSSSSNSAPTLALSDSEEEEEEQEEERESELLVPSTTSSSGGKGMGAPPPVVKKRKRYRKEYPGESKGITEEMRFVAMKLRNNKGSKSDSGNGDGDGGGVWEPTMEGFLKYLVDSKLVFETLERVVEDSSDVSYVYFRRTGLERSESLSRDLEWLGQQNIVIPEPSNPGVSYAAYLKELAEKSAPLFLCHFYNVYFSHVAGGQVIAKQVAEKLLEGRELEFYRCEGDFQELLKEVRVKLNRLGDHWSRDDKNKCLKEATKSFRYLGQIVRLIIS